MKTLLKTALAKTTQAIHAESESIPVHHLNESVFRFFLARSIMSIAPSAIVVPELDKIDLVVHHRDRVAFIEIKYLVHTEGLDPVSLALLYKKGFPSLSNQRQFVQSIDILRRRRVAAHVYKFAVVFWADPPTCRGRTYDAWYGSDAPTRDCSLSVVARTKAFRCTYSSHLCSSILFSL